MGFFEWFFLNEGRVVEPLFSQTQIFAITFAVVHLFGLAIYLGNKYKNNTIAVNKIMKITAFIMIFLYVIEVMDSFVVHAIQGKLDFSKQEGVRLLFSLIVNNVPLYLCDVAIWAIPIIAFSKGKVRTVASDFMGAWGIPMGVIGTYLAGNIFGIVPVFSFDGLLAIFIHVIPAAFAIFLYMTKTATIDRKNMLLSNVCFVIYLGLVLGYCHLFHPMFGTNFMFFFQGDGTPFDLFRPYVSLPVYQIIVFALYLAYFVLFYIVFNFVKKKVTKNRQI